MSAPTVLDGLRGTLSVPACDARLDQWSRRLLEKAEINVAAAGLENIPPGKAFVVMSNHQSHYDIPVLFQSLRLRVRMVAKAELFRVPLWAQAMRLSGFVEVDRKNRERAIESLARAKAALDSGTSIWIAPEGTRSDTGKLGEFKQGGFHLALDTGAPVLPVTIVGTRDALLARDWRVRRGAQVRVTVSPPIDPTQYGTERRGELVAAVRQAILQHLPAGSV